MAAQHTTLMQKMLRALSLRARLTLAIAGLCALAVLAATLALDALALRQQEARLHADAERLHQVLHNDLIELTLAGSPDKAAEFVIKINRFDQLHGLWLYDAGGQPRFRHGGEGAATPTQPTPPPASSAWQGRYWHSFPLQLEGQHLGDALYLTHATPMPARIAANLAADSMLLPLVLLLAWALAKRAARRFVRPIDTLLAAMDNPDSEQGRVALNSQDDIREAQRLFAGFNRLQARILSARQALNDELADKAHQASHDKLTGLLNRQGFEDAATRLLATASPSAPAVFGYLDLDQFKLINDTVGHPAGDVYLRQLAGLLLAWQPPGASVARLGGDEFGLLLANVDQQQASQLAEALLAAIRESRFIWEGQPFQVGASIGLVTFAQPDTPLAWLYQAADTACYSAKAAGRDRCVWHHPDNAAVREHQQDVASLNRIRAALGAGPDRFELWAQTIEPLGAPSDGQLRYEVLLRMRNGAGQLVSPGEFLPAAERHGEILKIDCWVLWHYLQQACQHPEHLAQLAFVDINVTGASLIHPDFRATLERALTTFAFPWSKLTLEITETSAVRNFEQARELIAFCQQHGIRFALDDFGTGMASFDYLKRLPFDVIKIDGAFVRSLLDDAMDQAVVEFISRAAALKGQHTVAEFVENADIAAHLATLGVDFGQGYHLGRPKPLQDWLLPPGA